MRIARRHVRSFLRRHAAPALASTLCFLAIAATCRPTSIAKAQTAGNGRVPATKPVDPAQREALIKRRDQLWDQANDLVREGKIEQAIAVAKEMLGLERRIFGNNHREVAFSLGWLADHYRSLDDFGPARAARAEQAQILSQIFGPRHWRVIDVRIEIQDLMMLTRLPASTRRLLEAAQTDADKFLEAYNEGNYEQAAEYARSALEARRTHLPNSHPDVARSATDYADALDGLDRLADAFELYEQALAIRQRIFRGEHPALALSLRNMGYAHRRLRDYTTARKFYQQSLEMYRRVYPEEHYPDGHADIAKCLMTLGDVFESMGEFDSALDHYQQSLAMRQRLYPPDRYPDGHDAVASALNNLAFLYDTIGDYATARSYYEQAVAIRRRLFPVSEYPDGHADLALSLNNLAAVISAQGDNATARKLFQEALEMRQRLYPLDEYPDGHPDIASSLNSMGFVLRMEGDYAAARNYYEQVLAMRRRLYPPEEYPDGHPDLGNILGNIAGLFDAQGNYQGALAYYKQVLEMYRRLYPEEKYPGGHRDLALALNNYGAALDTLGEYADAEGPYEAALEMYRRLYPEEDYPQGHVDIALVLNNLGFLYSQLEMYDLSHERYEEALAMRRRLYPEDKYPNGHPDIALSLNNLGHLHGSQEDYANARKYYAEALAMRRKLYSEEIYPDGHPKLVNSLNNLASLEVARGEMPQALAMLEDADRIERLGLRRFFDMSMTDAMRHYIAGQSGAVDWFISLARLYDAATPSAYRAVLARKTAVLDALIRRRKFERLQAADPQIAEQTAVLQDLRQQLADMALESVTDERLQRRDQLLARAKQIEAQIVRRVGSLVNEATRDGASLDQIAANLEPQQALVEIVRYTPYEYGAPRFERWLDDRFAAFVVSGDQDNRISLVDLGPAEDVDQQVAELRKLVARTVRELRFAGESELEKEYALLAGDLYESIFAPLAPHLAEVETVYLAPDGELTRIPFEALVDQEGRYLIESHAFAYLSSGNDLVRAADEPEMPATGTVVFAAPDYDLDGAPAPPSENLLAQLTRSAPLDEEDRLSTDVRGLSWDPLPATREEARTIGELLEDHQQLGTVTTLIGPDAMEEYLKRLHAPRILHLATHGFYLPDIAGEAIEDTRAPAEGPESDSATAARRLSRLRQLENPLLRSGIVLAGANVSSQQADSQEATSNGPSEDGWVTAEEIGLLDLVGTALVVLSACETGLGDVRTGEGVSGLRHAFIFAGAETLVTSLYKVPDQATQALMTEFYARLAGGDSKLAALRGAQQEIIARRRAQSEAAHPFFWASFILVGEPH